MKALSNNQQRMRELTAEETEQVTGGMTIARLVRLDAFLDSSSRFPRLDAFLDMRIARLDAFLDSSFRFRRVDP
jgi:hypothetical protein